MPRRTKTQKSVKMNFKKAVPAFKIKRKDLRFDVSLVILIGVLVFSLYLLLLALNKSADRDLSGSGQAIFSGAGKLGVAKKNSVASCFLNDGSIDFNLTVPAQLGEWTYKTGFVKSLADDALSDQYVQIFVPISDAAKSNNFDEKNKVILTFLKFSDDELKDLEKGCQKGNQTYCEAAGTKLAEKGGAVWVYKKEIGCPQSLKAKCALTEDIVKSFALK